MYLIINLGYGEIETVGLFATAAEKDYIMENWRTLDDYKHYDKLSAEYIELPEGYVLRKIGERIFG